MTRLLVSFLVLLSVTAASVADAQEKKIVVFAAASMKNALDDVDTAFTKQSGTNVVVPPERIMGPTRLRARKD